MPEPFLNKAAGLRMTASGNNQNLSLGLITTLNINSVLLQEFKTSEFIKLSILTEKFRTKNC